jgi:hypothetical protein
MIRSINKLKHINETVVSAILDNIRIEGAQPVSLNSIRSMMTDMLISQDGPIMATGRVHFWPGDDQIHHVPHGFRWPNGKNTVIMWNLWFFGEAIKGIGPYKFIPPSVDLSTQQCKTDRSRTAKVISTLVSITVNEGRIVNQRDINVNNSIHIFDFAFGELMRQLYPDNPDKRGIDLTVCSVYEKIRKVLH